MGLLSDLIGGGAAKLFTSIMDEIKLSPEKKAEVQMQLAQMEAQAEQADKDLDNKLNDIAGQNIRQETSSNDAFVRRARPAFLWVINIGIALSVLVFPIVNLCTGKGLTYPLLPQEYIDLYKIAYLGYVTARTVEKVRGAS